MRKNFQAWNALADAESGRLGRPSISDKMPVPAIIERNGGDIVFDFAATIRRVQPPTDLLDRFLTADTDTALVGFAKRFGPLALFDSEEQEFGWPDPQRLAGSCDDPHRESLLSWRRYQQQMKTVLALMNTYREERTPTIEDVAAFFESVGRVLQPKVRELAHQSGTWRRGLAVRAGLFYTRTLADACRLTPALRVDRQNRMEIVFQDAVGNLPGGGVSLCGALTIQLMTAFAGAAVVLCSSCGQPYLPKRRPAAGRNRYCERCGIRASWRDSKKRQRGTIRRKSK